MRLRLLPTLLILLGVIILSAVLFSVFRKKPDAPKALHNAFESQVYSTSFSNEDKVFSFWF